VEAHVSTWRVLRWAVAVIAIQALLLALLENLLAGFSTGGVGSVLLAGAVIVGVAGLTWPLIYRVSARVHPLIFPALSFALTGLVIFFTLRVVDRLDLVEITIRDLPTAILIWVSLATGSTLLGAMFSLNDDVAYDRFVTGPLRRKYQTDIEDTSPGFLFLEIDGLSEPSLRKAIEGGYVPTLARWLESGSHQLQRWETDLSSQTAASQAGILMGNNRDIPAFRWWDKQRHALVLASRRKNAAEIEQQLSSGTGLLANGGASRWNIFSGDATDCLGTYSRLGGVTGEGQRSYYAYFSNPFTVSRTTGLFIADVFRELFESIRQRVLDVQPRVRRSIPFAFIRAGTTVILPEASRFMLTADLYRGLPAIYCTFFAYDEVAHRAGVDRRDSLKVLRMLDRTIAHLERVAADAPRPYHLIVLSDHGQSQGANFRQRYGQTLGDLVRDLLRQYQVTSPSQPDEGLAGLSSALAEVSQRYNLRSARFLLSSIAAADRAHERRTEESIDDVDRDDDIHAQVVVLGSGNLGLISFADVPQRMTLEEITEQFPMLLPGLRTHAGVSLMLVQSEADGGMVIGSGGVYYLDRDLVVGEDPLAPFGKHAAHHFRRTNSFSNAPDILVMSSFDPQTSEVAAFEEHVGSHGGLGGPQTEPFLLYPSSLPLDKDEPILGAEALHRVLKKWMQDERTDQPQPVKEIRRNNSLAAGGNKPSS
jgi:putative membrane protein